MKEPVFTPVAPGRLAVLGIPDYRRLFLMGAMSSVARWLDSLAYALFAYQQTGSAFVVAMLTMFRMLPIGVMGGLFGVLGERVERRLLLLMVQSAMAMIALALAVLALSGHLAVWHLAVASLLNGIAWASDNTVRRLLIGEVVGTERLSAAMSIDIGAGNVSRMLGPIAGGTLVAVIGIEGALAIGSVLTLPGILFAASLVYRNPALAAGGPGLAARLIEGIAAVRRDRRLSGTMVVTIIFNLFGWPFTSMVPVIAQASHGLGPTETGVLAGLDGLGSLAAASVLALWLRPAAYRATYVGGTALFLLFIVGFALAPDPLSAGAFLIATGVAQAGFGVLQSTLVYVLAPAELRGRVFGVLTMCIGLAPIGFIHVGLLADAIGAPWATAAIGLEGLLALALTARLWRAI